MVQVGTLGSSGLFTRSIFVADGWYKRTHVFARILASTMYSTIQPKDNFVYRTYDRLQYTVAATVRNSDCILYGRSCCERYHIVPGFVCGKQ